MSLCNPNPSGFRLSAVLHLREGERDKMAHALARLENNLSSINHRLESISDERNNLQKLIRQSRIGRIPIEKLLDQHRYETHLDESEDLLRREKASLLEQFRTQRQKLVDANLELKKIEQLAARARALQVSQDLRREQKAIDDYSVMTSWKQKSNQMTDVNDQ